MIEVTDEMIREFRGVLAEGAGYRGALAAVLAIVERDADNRYARLLGANRKLVARLEPLERIEDERDRVLGQLEDAHRLLAKRNNAPNASGVEQ